jgi:heme-degrading monooxygenase HmoA
MSDRTIFSAACVTNAFTGEQTMVIERVELQLAPGREEEFLRIMKEHGEVFRNAQGCKSMKFGRGVENPSKGLLLLEWDAVESHVAFTKTKEFASFGTLAASLFNAPPVVEHFTLG